MQEKLHDRFCQGSKYTSNGKLFREIIARGWEGWEQFETLKNSLVDFKVFPTRGVSVSDWFLIDNFKFVVKMLHLMRLIALCMDFSNCCPGQQHIRKH